MIRSLREQPGSQQGQLCFWGCFSGPVSAVAKAMSPPRRWWRASRTTDKPQLRPEVRARSQCVTKGLFPSRNAVQYTVQTLVLGSTQAWELRSHAERSPSNSELPQEMAVRPEALPGWSTRGQTRSIATRRPMWAETLASPGSRIS